MISSWSSNWFFIWTKWSLQYPVCYWYLVFWLSLYPSNLMIQSLK